MAVFSKSNLSASSVQWGREVQQRIESIESEMSSLMVNDRSATKQLQDSYRRLDETVNGLLLADQNIIQTQEALAAVIENIYTPNTTELNGAIMASGTLSASSIIASSFTGTTITGATVQTAATGARVVMDSAGLRAYNASNTERLNFSTSTGALTLTGGSISGGSITGSTITGSSLSTSGTQHVQISGTSAYFYDSSGGIGGTLTAAYLSSFGQYGIMLTHGSTPGDINSPHLAITPNQTQITSGSSTIAIDGLNDIVEIAGFDLQVSTGTATFDGDIFAMSSYKVNGVTQAIIGPGGGVYPTNGNSLTGETVIQDGSSGILRRYGSSSRRFKNSEASIWDSEELNPLKLLNIPVKTFKYNPGYIEGDDPNHDKTIPGLMAEDVNEVYPIATYNNRDGLIQNWMDRPVLVGTLALVQKLYEKIDALESRLAILEGN